MMTVKANNRIAKFVNPAYHYQAQPYDAPWIRLDRNESHFGISRAVQNVLENAVNTLSRYPENTGSTLRGAIADYHHVQPEQILIGNGSFELIWLIASVYLDETRESIMPEITFGAYSKFSQLVGSPVHKIPLDGIQIDLDGLLRGITERTKVVWLCNPNNPTGHYISRKILKAFLDRVPSDVLVVIDEAYIEFTDEYEPRETADLLKDFSNVILLHTFSKFYGLASLRIGYALASPEIISTLMQFRIPPNHSRVAEEAARVSIEDGNFQNRIHQEVIGERAYLYAALQKLKVLYEPTQSNFLIFRLPDHSVEDVIREFKKDHLVIKDAGEFGMHGWLRLTIGDRAINKRVIEVIKTLLGGETK